MLKLDILFNLLFSILKLTNIVFKTFNWALLKQMIQVSQQMNKKLKNTRLSFND